MKLFNDIAVLNVASGGMSAVVGCKRGTDVFVIGSDVEKEYSGFADGEWFNSDETLKTAVEALREVVEISGTRAKTLFVGVPAEFCAVKTKRVSVSLDRTRRVIDADIDYLLKKGDNFDKSKFVTINSSAVYFSADTSDKLYTDVRGMSASSIEGFVSYILCERSFTDLFDAAAAKAGFKDVRYLSSVWAEGLALFDRDRRDTPFVLIDVGYISSSVSLGRGEGLLDVRSFSMGGAHIAADIFEALEVPYELASEAKELIDLNLSYSEDAVLVSDGEYTVYAADACEIARARLDVLGDIISEAMDSFNEEAPSYLPVYLTGEGIASIRGAKKYLSERIQKNIEIVTPKLPGFGKAADSSKISVLIVAETLSKNGFWDRIKGVIGGGKK